MEIRQFVMAYGAEQDRLRALLPEGYSSLRPVLRINAGIRDNTAYLEYNTAVEREGVRGWLNIGSWENIPFTVENNTVTFRADQLTISFTGTGIEGGCPAEKDNAGCFFPGGSFRPAETITSRKEFCDCSFRWDFDGRGASGRSIGKTLPAVPSEPGICYPKLPFTVENAALIPCEQVLGAYTVRFFR